MDKKTLTGIVLMAVIFIGYVVYSSKQQAEYQEYLAQVEAQTQQEVAETEAAVAEPSGSDSLAREAAESEARRMDDMLGASLSAARDAAAEQITMSNDYISAEFTTAGGMLSKVTLNEYTKYAPRGERNEKVVLFDPASAEFDLEFYIKKNLKNVKINTSEYVFTSQGVRRGEGFKHLRCVCLCPMEPISNTSMCSTTRRYPRATT